MSKPNIAVLGQGIVGLSQAYHLAKNGVQTTVFGRQDTLGMGSHAAVGLMTTKGHLEGRIPRFIFKLLCFNSFKNWIYEIEEASGIEIPKLFGSAQIYFSESEALSIFDRLFKNEDPKNLSYENLNSKELKKTQPIAAYLNAKGGYFFKNDIWVDVPTVLKALKAACLKFSNIKFVDNMVITCETTMENTWSLGLESSKSELGFSDIVLCTGAFSDTLLRSFEFPVEVFKPSQGFTIKGKLNNPYNGCLIYQKQNLVAHDKRFIFGSAEQEAALEEKLSQFLNQSDYSNTEALWGRRSKTKDRDPIIGAYNPPRSKHPIYLNIGHYKNGVLCAHRAAEWISSYILDLRLAESEQNLLRAFSPSRFV